MNNTLCGKTGSNYVVLIFLFPFVPPSLSPSKLNINTHPVGGLKDCHNQDVNHETQQGWLQTRQSGLPTESNKCQNFSSYYSLWNDTLTESFRSMVHAECCSASESNVAVLFKLLNPRSNDCLWSSCTKRQKYKNNFFKIQPRKKNWKKESVK